MAQFIRQRVSVDSDLHNVDPSVMLGAIVGYDFTLGGARKLSPDFHGSLDLANSNGFLGTLYATYRMPMRENWRTALSLESTWASSDYLLRDLRQ